MVHRLEVRWRLPLALLAGGLVACAGAHRAGAPAWADDPCALGSPASAPPGAHPAAPAEEAARPIVVALPGPVDPAHAPVPRTEAERLVFAIALVPSRDGPALQLRPLFGDPRNALDAGVDLLLTVDPDAIRYASSSAGFHTVPLGWDRGYLLAARAAPRPAGGLRIVHRHPGYPCRRGRRRR